jgi:hypothetical protein
MECVEMLTLKYKKDKVPNFDSLIEKPFDIESPSRSTVPFLAYWSDPQSQVSKYSSALGFTVQQEATLTFEYTVEPSNGKGNASHTDLMITAPDLALGTEAKYKEPKYSLVSSWLGDPPSDNRKLVLESWLEMVNLNAGCQLTIQQVKNITYQLIHRTASVCNIKAKTRAVVYHYFDPVDSHSKYYENQLRNLASLIAAPHVVQFFLCTTTIFKSEPYAQMQQEWLPNKGQDFSDRVRKLLRERNVATFGQPLITKCSGIATAQNA